MGTLFLSSNYQLLLIVAADGTFLAVFFPALLGNFRFFGGCNLSVFYYWKWKRERHSPQVWAAIPCLLQPNGQKPFWLTSLRVRATRRFPTEQRFFPRGQGSTTQALWVQDGRGWIGAVPEPPTLSAGKKVNKLGDVARTWKRTELTHSKKCEIRL